MGIEVQGLKWTGPEGKVFRVEFWAWRPIHALTRTLCSDLLDEATLKGMTFGNGAGTAMPETCAAMADRFERWLAGHGEGFVLEAGIRTTPDGRFLTEQELADNSSLETISPYEVKPDQLQKWIQFLRACGGFEVW